MLAFMSQNVGQGRVCDRPCKSFPLISFDHDAKFDCSVCIPCWL